jgi:hypothetical protein
MHRFALVASPLTLVGGCAALTILSNDFRWDAPFEGRPILLMLLVLGIMGVGFVISVGWIILTRESHSPWWILVVALSARILLMPSQMIQESDSYRYVLDGMATLNGVNPYQHSPERIRFDAPKSMGREFEKSQARMILARVSYPELPTIYPPLAQMAFALGGYLTPWDWQGQRWVFLGLDLLIIGLLMTALPRLGLPMEWSMVYAWNPLILKEIVNSVHSESLVGLMILGLVLALIRASQKPTLPITMLTGFFLAGAVLSKIYPVILVPIVVGVLIRRGSPLRNLTVFTLTSLLLTFLLVFPFAGVGWERLIESLIVYSKKWESNSGAFAVVALLTPHARLVCAALPGLVAIFHGWRLFRTPDTMVSEKIIRAFQHVLLLWFLLLPAAFPWYATALIAVSALRPRPWTFVLSMVFCLYYLRFNFLYQPVSLDWMVWTRVLEHGSVWVAVMLSSAFMLRSHRKDKQRCVSG